MKLQLDTTNKTVKIEENIKISKLISTLKALLPNDWKEFTLETHTTIVNWREPYIIEKYREIPWYQQPWICNTANSLDMVNSDDKLQENYSLKAGIFNVEA